MSASHKEIMDTLELQCGMIMSLQQHLNRVEDTLTEVLTKLNPVHEHAAWVDGLRGVLHRYKILNDTRLLTSE